MYIEVNGYLYEYAESPNAVIDLYQFVEVDFMTK